MICFECGRPAITPHHVVPKSRGGTKTIDLCGKCHAKAHHRDGNMSTAALTKEALQAKRARGERVGSVPFGFQLAPDGVKLIEHKREQQAIGVMVDLRNQGWSLRRIIDELNHRQIKTKCGGRWHAKVVRDICQRKPYSKVSSVAKLGAPPYGYRCESDIFVEIEEEQRVIQIIDEMRSQDKTYQAIAEELRRLGIKTKNGGLWHSSTVGNICRRLNKTLPMKA